MAESYRLLIVDDEEGIRLSLRGILEDEGHSVFEAKSAEDALVFLEKESVDLVFLDIWLPQMDGLTLLDILHANYPFLPILMISGHGTIETAVTAIKKGAHDFIEKPLSLEKVLLAVERTLEFHALKRENLELKERFSDLPLNGPIGTSPHLQTLREQILRVAPLDTSVFIAGENGTGKELVARAVHHQSKRKDKPLVALNCAAIPEELIESELFGHEKGAFTGADALKLGKFEMANQGTLFLDEIGDMSLKTQAKILRILQEKTYERVGGGQTLHANVRIIAATNKNLATAIADGSFREDLYYRLCVFPLHVPALRERGSDIILLANHFIESLAQELNLSPITFAEKAKQQLLTYSWPGNVRELRNFIERMLILHAGEIIQNLALPQNFQQTTIHLPLDVLSDALQEKDVKAENEDMSFLFHQETLPADFKEARNFFEAHFLATKLQECGGNIAKLAETIGLERSYLYRKLKMYNISDT